MKRVFVIAGIGGQGVLSIGQTVSQYMNKIGKKSTFSPIYGPQQRGGPAKCTVIVEDEGNVLSPMAKTCDVLMVLNQKSVRTYQDDLKPGGLFIYNSCRVDKPTEREDVVKLEVPADDIAIEAGSIKMANSVMIPFLLRFFPDVDPDIFLEDYLKKFEKKGEEAVAANRKAFKAGEKLAQQIEIG